MDVFYIFLGLLTAGPVYAGTRRFLLSRKPFISLTTPSNLTPIIAAYQQRQLEIEGKVSPVAIEASKQSHTSNNDNVAELILITNYEKWSGNKAQIPFVAESIKVLETIAGMGSLPLTTEESHNLEVLSNQTEQLLTNFFATPEAIRSMPAVQTALQEQLDQIKESVGRIEAQGAETFIRNLQVGTEFIRTKFKE